jgi:lysophospholipase L1-like esterase
MRVSRALVLVGVSLLCTASAARADFPLRDGDIWVMAGDSITAQHLHSNYFEAFCFARYPKLKFGFRNSGVGGHTIPSTLARFDYDIAAWKPTVVSVELGMNDKGGTPTEKFIQNMGTMVARIRAIGARPVIFAASPVNSGETMKNLGGNKRLHEYADALRDFCAKEKIPYADQFHDLIDVWGRNKPRENLANALGMLRGLANDQKLEGGEHLRAFLAVQDKSPLRPVSLHGDAVHPGAPGQLMMAAALLKDLGADGFVSSAIVDAAGQVIEAKGCKIDAVKLEGSGLVFDRLDECLPFPIPDEARAVLSIDPTILEMSRYTLKVTGLKGGRYELKINAVPTATLTAKDLEAGVNLTAFGPSAATKQVNPVAAQGKAVLSAVTATQNLVSQWRSLSQRAHAAGAAADLKTQLATLTRQVEEADAKVRAAARPRKLHFELIPAP